MSWQRGASGCAGAAAARVRYASRLRRSRSASLDGRTQHDVTMERVHSSCHGTSGHPMGQRVTRSMVAIDGPWMRMVRRAPRNQGPAARPKRSVVWQPVHCCVDCAPHCSWRPRFPQWTLSARIGAHRAPSHSDHSVRMGSILLTQRRRGAQRYALSHTAAAADTRGARVPGATAAAFAVSCQRLCCVPRRPRSPDGASLLCPRLLAALTLRPSRAPDPTPSSTLAEDAAEYGIRDAFNRARRTRPERWFKHRRLDSALGPEAAAAGGVL